MNLVGKKRYRMSSLARKEELIGYSFIAPQIIGLLCFSLIPVFFSLYVSFCKWDLLSSIKWRGISNYEKIFSKKETWIILGNTAKYVAIYVPFSLITGLLLALGLNKEFRGCYLIRTFFYLPHITSSVAICVVWSLMFQPESGVINSFLNMLGIDGPGWINSTKWSIPSISIVTIWISQGHNMILFLAGLKGIDTTYYEAASIDGAGSWQKFRNITFPLLTPTIFMILCTSLISGFQMFNESFMLTGGGPGNSSTTLVLKIYTLAFESFKMGDAAVYAWLLFVIVFICTILQFSLQNRWVNYDV